MARLATLAEQFVAHQRLHRSESRPNRELVKYFHNGRAVLIEKEPIKVARVQVRETKPGENPLLASILVHPRYVPVNVPHEITRLPGRLYGGTLYVLLDMPILVGDQFIDIINFKRAGADADKSMAIYPAKTCYMKGLVNRKSLENEPWGGLTDAATLEEANNSALEANGIEVVPHISANLFPYKINEYIFQLEGGPLTMFGQIVRGVPNTFRFYDLPGITDRHFLSQLDVQKLADIDAKLILLEFSLRKQGLEIVYDGTIAKNRYANGVLTDKGNFNIIPSSEVEVGPDEIWVPFFRRVLNSTLKRLLDLNINPTLYLQTVLRQLDGIAPSSELLSRLSSSKNDRAAVDGVYKSLLFCLEGTYSEVK